jgi:hypothetical protein
LQASNGERHRLLKGDFWQKSAAFATADEHRRTGKWCPEEDSQAGLMPEHRCAFLSLFQRGMEK